METASPSVFTFFIWIIATFTKIGTFNISTQDFSLCFNDIKTPLYTHTANYSMRCVKRFSLKLLPFSVLVHSAGELLHTP